jgi:P pilus assembly chaperone PapD
MNIRHTFLTVLAVMLVLTPAVALAQGLGPVTEPTGTQSGADLPAAVLNVVNALLILAALAAMVFLLIGGIRYIFSQGDEEKAATAKNTILYAVIGLIVIGLAAVVVNFIVAAVGAAPAATD